MDNTAKTENVDLRAQKSTNLLMGYVLALAAMFVAFEYTQREVKVVETDKIYEFRMEEDMIPITQQQETVAPPPAAAPTVMEIINEVEDDTELPEEEVETTEEVNQAITTVVGTGAPSAMVATGKEKLTSACAGWNAPPLPAISKPRISSAPMKPARALWKLTTTIVFLIS